METVKILHCADLHIGAAAGVPAEKGQIRRAEALLTFENIIKTAEDNGVKLVLIAGDLLCSNQVEFKTVSRILECIAAVPDIKVVFAAGNHDPLNSESPFTALKLPANFHILPATDSVIYFEDINTRVYGRSFSEVYMQGEKRFSLAAESGSINVMCQHGEVRSDISSDYNSITPEFIDNCGMDYIALGHIHKRSEIMRRGDTFFAYSGCAEGLGFDELGDKGVYIGEVGKAVCNLSFKKTSIRTYEKINVDVTGCENAPAAAERILSAISEKYGEGFADNLYKIILTGGVADGCCFDTAEIAARIMQTVFFAKVSDKTEVAVAFDVLRNENSLKGIFVDKMLSLIENEPDNADMLRAALSLGLKAFSSEVGYSED